MQDKVYRLRPSVSFVPIDEKKSRYEFFLSNIRKNIELKLEDDLVDFVRELDGNKSIKELKNKYKIKDKKIKSFINYLKEKCIIEKVEIAKKIKKNRYRRIINFLQDYIPSTKVLDEFEKIKNSYIVVIGLGAMGSWICQLLAQSGVKNYTLIDDDNVERTNLNRSLYYEDDIGRKKVDVITENMKEFNSSICIDKRYEFIYNYDELINILSNISNDNILVINCADYPNVDTTSEIVHKACMELKIPYIISGGYNLHLSLIGPTVLPYKSACYKCINTSLEEKNENLNNMKKLSRENRNIGSLVSLSGVSASFVVNEAIRVVSEKIDPSMTNRRGEYNFFTHEINYTNFNKRSDCEDCGGLFNE